ncbi:MAG TPA: beta-ketoacyl synthase chain length factor, partial [Bacteroidia bacterium]|nr:beta-ketoacyl synthase chain length factor [Bacteroidia bacterium]
MYIHKSVCISPQHTFPEINLQEVLASADNKLTAIESKYENIPLSTLRRMGKAVRMGVGAGMNLVKDYPHLDGIIIGTANGGMEDCIKFLNQIIDYDEGTLTPKNFVQSTTNAIAAQISLTAQNTGYNITHVHRGLAFENALLDAFMLMKENPESVYLLGGGDEISTYNFNIDNLAGSYKKEII